MLQIQPIDRKTKTPHPLERYMTRTNAPRVKTYHNSVNNPQYPRPKAGPPASRVTFTVIGNRVTRQFLDCQDWVTTLHTYRSKQFAPPVVRGLTQLEWNLAWSDLKVRYGGDAFCIKSPVAVLLNNEFLGDDTDLKRLLGANYMYRLSINYYKRGVEEFAKYIESSGRTCAYFHVTIDSAYVGSLIFMLFTDLVPLTCENFLRLCRARRGGYGGTRVHRLVADGWIQCGGYALKPVDLPCENYAVPHDRRGVLSMANDGRHCNNSTQFSVTLQPASWMDHKYVAFGQLIDGEETLRRVEAVPTRYESPLSAITFCKVGELTLQRKSTPCAHTVEYLEKHIFVYTEFAEQLIEELFDMIYLELEYRLIAAAGGGYSGEDQPDQPPLQTTERFFKTPEDIVKDQKVAHNSDADVNSKASGSRTVNFGLGYSTSDLIIREPLEPRKEYLPLSDVPYPGECDSDWDLDQIKASDLQPFETLSNRIPPTPTPSQHTVRRSLETDEAFAPESSDNSFESDKDPEVQKYLRLNADRVSFAGTIIRNIGRALGQLNLFSNMMRSKEKIPDKTKIPDKAKTPRSVVIAVPESEDSDDDYPHVLAPPDRLGAAAELQYCDLVALGRRSVVIAVPESEDSDDEYPHVLARRPTGFVNMLAPDSDSENSECDEPESVLSLTDLGKMLPQDQLKKSVRIAQSSSSGTGPDGGDGGDGGGAPARRPRSPGRGGPGDISTDDRCSSGLDRLLEHAARNNSVDDDPGPRLKDYKPLSELVPKNFFLTSPTLNRRSLTSAPEAERAPRDPVSSSAAAAAAAAAASSGSSDNLLNLRHGSRLVRRFSSDYVHSRFMLEKAKQRRLSIRTAEFAKKRPSLSVDQYKRKVSSKDQETARLHKAVETVLGVKGLTLNKSCPNVRLPGDTPTYSYMEGVDPGDCNICP